MESRSKSSNRAPSPVFNPVSMNAQERARAEAKMYQAMMLADLTLAASRRLHSVLRDATKVVNCMFTARSDHLKNGVVHTD